MERTMRLPSQHIGRRVRIQPVLLTGQNYILGIGPISIGTLTSTLVHLREVWKGIVLANAAGFLCVHNHLTANPAPSPEDKAMTKQIRDLAELCDVPFLDHVIVCPDSYSAMQEDAWFV
jgi:DNA repair protein RadC